MGSDAAASTVIGIETESGSMPARLWLPPSGAGPGLLLLQEIFGISPYIRARAADLAALGYVVLAPEVYWRLDDATVDENAPDLLEKALGLVSRLDWPTAVTDSAAALDQLRLRPEITGGVGLIGFCFGGGLAFNVAAVTSPDVLVSYYGSALPNLLDLAPQVTAPSLHHFGTADAYIDQETVERIRTAVTGNPATEFVLYDGAGHAFDNTLPDFHHPEASRESWARTTDFLAKHLPLN
ncbi:dienelactone hydrolase family protein [Kribbella sp. NBC_01245]|uniref:dienelactone hydrolase family protein n=1 Tax=Kribbella sp. NBC_01245 TaxID=2903578 RepID=UPI002E2B555E|nr:dienelactone hydrolase family protein [Kribbella sp. NBC_01245]